MIDRTTLLFALPGFRVLSVTPEPDGGRLVRVESFAKEGGCPSCGVMSSRIKDRPLCRLKDLPHGSVPLHVWVSKRRFLCTEKLCARGSFTEVSDQVPARSRLTKRLRTKVSAAVTTTNRAMSEVAGEYGVTWWTVHRILVATAVQVLGQAAPTTMIGIDETRARSVRWFRQESGWARSDPWMTSIVDLDPTHSGGIIGLVPGRSGACVEAWLALQTKEFRDGVTVVAIDPSAPYASGIRRALPQARIVLDHFHLVMLANKMLTDVRQRVQHEQQGRRGMKVDPAWAHRRLLLRAGNDLGPKALARLKTVFETDDPTNEISAAWASRSSCVSCCRRTARTATAGTRPPLGGPGSWRPVWTPTCPRRPGSRARSRSGGLRSKGSWSWAKRTPGPRATTASSSRSNASPAGSVTRTTTKGA